MPSVAMNILALNRLKVFVDQHVPDRRCSLYSVYMCHLVRREQLGAAKEQMRARISSGFNSPTGKTWGALRDALLRRAKLSAAK